MPCNTIYPGNKNVCTSYGVLNFVGLFYMRLYGRMQTQKAYMLDGWCFGRAAAIPSLPARDLGSTVSSQKIRAENRLSKGFP